MQRKAAEATPGTGEDGQMCCKLSRVCSEVRFWDLVRPSADTGGTQPQAKLVANTGNILNGTTGERTETGGALGLGWARPQSYSPPHGTLEGTSQNKSGRSSCMSQPVGEMRRTEMSQGPQKLLLLGVGAL